MINEVWIIANKKNHFRGFSIQMMKIVHANPGLGEPMTEEETNNFLANDNNNLLVRIAFMDEKGEPNITPTAYYFNNLSINLEE
jgi:hypothetical protein